MATPPAFPFAAPPELAPALRALRAAARLVVALREDWARRPRQKEDQSPVTLADLGGQAILGRLLGQDLPSLPLVAEEEAGALGGPEGEALAAALAPALAASLGLAAAPSAAKLRAWIDRGQADPPGDGAWWAADPIDGTKGYVGGGQYALALALLQGGRPVLGLLACPALPPEALLGRAALPEGPDWRPAGPGSLILGLAGQGAWLTSLDEGADDARRGEPPHPADRSDLDGSGDHEAGRGPLHRDPFGPGPWWPLASDASAGPRQLPWCESLASSHSDQVLAARVTARLGMRQPPLRLDSQVKYALLAAGRAAACLRIPKADYVEKVWDHAAGACILEAAGGRVTDLAGRPLDFTQGRGLAANRGLLLSSGPWHADLVAAYAVAAGAADGMGDAERSGEVGALDAAGAIGAVGAATGADRIGADDDTGAVA